MGAVQSTDSGLTDGWRDGHRHLHSMPHTDGTGVRSAAGGRRSTGHAAHEQERVHHAQRGVPSRPTVRMCCVTEGGEDTPRTAIGSSPPPGALAYLGTTLADLADGWLAPTALMATTWNR